MAKKKKDEEEPIPLSVVYENKADRKLNKLLNTTVDSVSYENLQKLNTNYVERLNTDPEYSVEVDPLELYNMTKEEKEFVKYWIDFMDINLVCLHMNIEPNQALDYYHTFSVQQEIRRIRMSMYLRQFATRMLTVEEIGGYLTAVLTDQVPLKDRLSEKDKLQVAKLLLDINKLKAESIANPTIITYADFEENLKDLSTKSIRQLIKNSMDNAKEINEKTEIINEMDKDKLFTPEDQQYLKTLSQKELTEMQNQMNKEGW